MCPFCISNTVWIAAGMASTGSIAATAVATLWHRKPSANQQEGTNDNE